MRITERLLWRYIDGDVDEQERARVREAIGQDDEAFAAYQRLLEFHNLFLDFFDKRSVGLEKRPMPRSPATADEIRATMLRANKSNDPYSFSRNN